MCGKGNSGFEKEKCVLLSRKKGKEIELIRKKKKNEKEEKKLKRYKKLLQ